jgi:hypothetical protein
VNSEIEQLRQQFEDIKKDALQLSASLNDAQFNWTSSPQRWSMSECLAHLNVVDGLDLPLIERAIQHGGAAGWTGNGPFRYGWLSRKFVSLSESPARLKMRAPKVYLPPSAEPKEKVVSEFLSIHDNLLQLVAQSDGLDLARIRVPSPFPLVTFSLGQRFLLLAAHDRRHLRQAWEVRKNSGFPK